MFAYMAGTLYITDHRVPPQLYGLLFAAGISASWRPTRSTRDWCGASSATGY
jgi:hypothetical protein